MNINWKFVAGALALIVAYDEMALHINAKKNEALKAAFLRHEMRVRYLVSKLEENEIPVDAFDQLAMDTIKDM